MGRKVLVFGGTKCSPVAPDQNGEIIEANQDAGASNAHIY
jgi:hypothetical protein